MSKTVDDLVWIYLHAFAEEGGHDITAVSKPNPRTVEGVKAIVRALRDEMQTKVCNDGKEECCGQAWQDVEGMVCCGRPNYVITTDHVLDVFNEILGPAGGEVAGRVGETKHPDVTSPATAPAPAVCEWQGISEMGDIVHYTTKHGVTNDLNMWRRDKTCAFCGLPIKFKTEAQR